MTLSRTARILIALLLLAAAAFVWINFFATAPDSGGPISGPTVSVPRQEQATPSGDAAQDAATQDGDASDGAAQAEGGDAVPTVVAEPETSVVGRDVVVAELPFLITEPPAAQEAAAEEAPGEAADRDRPGTNLRASVNPFSPIVVQQPQAAATPAATAPAEASGAAAGSPDVVDVAVPAGPPVETVAAQAPTPTAPAPGAVAPASPRAAGLPRPLPGGTLPVAPDLLTSSRAESAPRAPANLPELAAVREPTGPGEAPTLRTLGGERIEATSDPEPLGPGDVPAAGIPNRPLVSGADALSRYLRDSNVAFTGSVVGSVGVGVFRLTGAQAPIILALGQSLPDTEIVLTDLRGQAAEFTLGDTTHVLNLDLRR